jgi:hypothetical protein
MADPGDIGAPPGRARRIVTALPLRAAMISLASSSERGTATESLMDGHYPTHFMDLSGI